LQTFIKKDLKGIEKVLNELGSAREFARDSANAFKAASLSGLTSNQPETVASQILQAIRANNKDSALSAHSSLDRKLVGELLKDN
jgi:hypothetical protein